jgi:hypothetical protein
MIVSTHSPELLSDSGIAPEEVILLMPSKGGTRVAIASDDEQVRALIDGGVSMAESVLPRTAPANADQLDLFGDR